MQRGFAPILIVLLVAVLGIGGYFVYTIFNGANTQSDLTISPDTITTPANNYNYTETRPIYKCSKDIDCILVKDSYCKMVKAINGNHQNEWIKQDELDYKKAISSKQTCKVTTPKSVDMKNYTVKCDTRIYQCQAIPKTS